MNGKTKSDAELKGKIKQKEASIKGSVKKE